MRIPSRPAAADAGGGGLVLVGALLICSASSTTHQWESRTTEWKDLQDSLSQYDTTLDKEAATTSLHDQPQKNDVLLRSSYPTCRMGYGIKDLYPLQDNYYHHQTCFWCYHFVPPHRKRHDLEIVKQVITLDDGVKRNDFRFQAENSTYYFDPDDVEGWEYVTDAMADQLEADKLTSCCRDAVHCCQMSLDEPPGDPEHCPRTWDGWVCFPDTPPGETVTFTCPSYAYKGKPECSLKGSKVCWSNGTWSHDEKGIELTNYASCSHKEYHLRSYYWEAAMHAVSMVTLTPAVFLLVYYRQLRVQRFYLHLNFFIALFGKSLFTVLDLLVIRVPEYTGSNTLIDDNGAGCKTLVWMMKFFSLAVWTWMLAEGAYIHRLIVAALKGGGKTYVYITIGWVPAMVLCMVWAVCRALLEDYQCWLGDDLSSTVDLYLITEVPKFLILIINVVLMANMVRVLLTQLRGISNDEVSVSRRAVKATGFLLPLFGLQFFCTLYIPPASTSCAVMQVYMSVAIALDGLQGMYVAVAYCFLNREVKLQVRRSVFRVRNRFATDKSYVTYDPRTDVSLIHSGVTSSAAPNPSLTETNVDK